MKINSIFIVMFILPIASIYIPFRKYIDVKHICWFSFHFWDVHDYPIEFGGDGVPTHFHDYKCYNCGKKFTI